MVFSPYEGGRYHVEPDLFQITVLLSWEWCCGMIKLCRCPQHSTSPAFLSSLINLNLYAGEGWKAFFAQSLPIICAANRPLLETNLHFRGEIIHVDFRWTASRKQIAVSRIRPSALPQLFSWLGMRSISHFSEFRVAAFEKSWHILDSQGRILALALWGKSRKCFLVFPLRSEG